MSETKVTITCDGFEPRNLTELSAFLGMMGRVAEEHEMYKGIIQVDKDDGVTIVTIGGEYAAGYFSFDENGKLIDFSIVS